MSTEEKKLEELMKEMQMLYARLEVLKKEIRKLVYAK
jgi:prefoldin subunit 5